MVLFTLRLISTSDLAYPSAEEERPCPFHRTGRRDRPPATCSRHTVPGAGHGRVVHGARSIYWLHLTRKHLGSKVCSLGGVVY